MAIDFPASPTIGQQSNGFVFDGTKWKVSTTSTAPSSISPTPPTNPTIGDLWFNSTDGTMYFYYNDGNTSQWVESRAPIVANGYYSPNYIINGGMDIWQRGTSSTTNAAYNSADRWWVYYNAGTTTFSKETSVVPTGFNSALKMSQATANASMVVYQFVETLNTRPLVGKTVTLSAYVAATAATTFNPEISWSTTVDAASGASWTTLTASGGTWSIPSGSTYARFSATYTIPSGAQTLRVGGVTAVTVGNSVYLAGVQLEEGSAATTFRRNANSIQGELAACQRYYVRLRGSGGTAFTGIPAHGGALSGTTMLGMINVPVTMRVDPTAVEAYALRLVNLQDNVSLAVTDVALSSSWANGYAPYAVFTCSGGGLSANSYYRVGANNNGGSYLGLSAEL